MTSPAPPLEDIINEIKKIRTWSQLKLRSITFKFSMKKKNGGKKIPVRINKNTL